MSALSDQVPSVTDAQIAQMVQSAAASAGYQTAAQTNAAIAAQTPPIVSGLLPIPTYRFNVLPAAVVLGTNTVAGVLIDRPATLSKLAYYFPVLTGVGAGLTVKLQKNGVDIPSASWSVVLATFTELTIPGSVSVVKGDRIDVVFVGVGVFASTSLFEAYIATT